MLMESSPPLKRADRGRAKHLHSAPARRQRRHGGAEALIVLLNGQENFRKPAKQTKTDQNRLAFWSWPPVLIERAANRFPNSSPFCTCPALSALPTLIGGAGNPFSSRPRNRPVSRCNLRLDNAADRPFCCGRLSAGGRGHRPFL